MKQTVIIFKGLPASGKTTLAKQLVLQSGGKLKRINKDEIRAMVDAGQFSKERETYVLGLRNDAIHRALKAGYDVIVDDTNLHPKHQLAIENIAKEYDAQLQVNDSFLSVPIRECIRRDSLRAEPVGKNVIRHMSKTFGAGKIEPYFLQDALYVVICDLDGTLAHMGDRNPYDDEKCEIDKVNKPVAHYLKLLSKEFPIFYFSGRQEKSRLQTERWLLANGLAFHQLLAMRPTGDQRKDSIVKEEMFNQHINKQFNVHVVIDDRKQVCEMWRDKGLIVFQVDEGDF